MSTNHLVKRYSRLAHWASIFSARYPKYYLGVAVLVMLLGYAFLFLFPYLVFEGTAALFREIPHARTMEHWIVVEVWSAILLFCLFLSRQIFRLHFPRVSGLKLSKDLTPDLYALVVKVQKYTSRPSIRNIMLTDQHELRIEETPRLGYPFGTSNTLVIGLPMLQTLSKEQFRGLLLRRMSQYSSGRFRPTHWLFRTRLLWRRYSDALGTRKRFGDTPMRWFFSLYTPLFEVLTLPAARLDELAGDSAVLEWMNDGDYFDAVKSSTIADIFLDAQYWRKVHQQALNNPTVKLKPFAELDNISGHLKSMEFRKKWLHGALVAKQNFYKPVPTLSQRMENIGQSKLRDVPTVDKTAAETCLGEVRKNFIPIIDELWRSTTFAKWKKDYEKRRADIERVKSLSRKSQKKVLNVREMVLYARLAKRLRGDLLHRSIAKIIKRNVENLLPPALILSIFQRKIKPTEGGDNILQ